MIASTSGMPKCAARTTDSGLPPTPTQVRIDPDAVFGYTCWSVSGGRMLPCQVTASSFRRCESRSIFSSKSFS